MKKLLVLALISILVFSFAACTPTQQTADGGNTGEIPKPASPVKYSMASGSIGGNFYLVGGGIAQVINNELPAYFNFTAETTGGGTANLGMIQNGDAELGISMTSSLYESQQGEVEWTAGVKHDKLRVAASLYPSWLTVYTPASSGIKSMADLNGKIVGLGSKGMAMDAIFRQFFADRGIAPKQIHNDGHAATATAMNNGVIDAAVLFSYPPFAAISELESTKALAFVPLTEEEQQYLTKKYNFYRADAMPGGSYKGAPDSVAGVSEWNMLATSSEVPEEYIYLIVKTLCEKTEDLTAIHPSLKYVTAKDTLNSNIYLHAGAVRYLQEVGVEVPSNLIPPEYSK